MKIAIRMQKMSRGTHTQAQVRSYLQKYLLEIFLFIFGLLGGDHRDAMPLYFLMSNAKSITIVIRSVTSPPADPEKMMKMSNNFY